MGLCPAPLRHLVDGQPAKHLNLLEFCAQRQGGRSVVRVAGHCPFDDCGDYLGDTAFTQVRCRFTGDAQELHHQLLSTAALECRMTGERGEQGGPEPVHI